MDGERPPCRQKICGARKREREREKRKVSAGFECKMRARGEEAHLVVDQCGEWEVVKEVGEVLPDVCVAVLPEALVVEAVDLGDLSGLVVAAEDGDAVAVSDLECDEQRDGLDRVVAAVYVVAHEEVVGVWRVAADAEEFGEVVKLAVDVAADGDGAADGLHIRLAEQDLARLVAKTLDVVFRELLALAEMRDPRVLLCDVDHGARERCGAEMAGDGAGRRSLY